MKFNKEDLKKQARKFRYATEDEMINIKKEYENLTSDINAMSSPTLLMIYLIGIFIIIYFESNLVDVIGLVIFIYPFYIFARRGAYRDGFSEGYFDSMVKNEQKEQEPQESKEPKITEIKIDPSH